MSVPVTNFAKCQVSTGYDAAATTVVLVTGHGSRLPSTFPFPLVWWNATDYPDPSDDPDVEIVSCTARTTDTLTVARAAEGTTATAKNAAGKTYRMLLSFTKAMYDALVSRALTQSHRGLRLQTYPTSISEAAVVYFTADSIVMDDGEEVQGWTGNEANITLSGLNGLDTGSESGSAWYEVYAIRKSSDGTKGGLLHRAKDWGGLTGYSTNIDGSHACRDAAARTKLAQGFTLSGLSGQCPFVDVLMFRTGSPDGSFWFTIEANSGGVPSGTPLATSDKLLASRLTTTAQGLRIPFRTPYSLSDATQYHLVLQGDSTISGANYISWSADTTAAAYAGGAKAAYDGATWTTDTDDDFYFAVYVERNNTAVTMPTGYDQKALLGYVRNNASSNFKFFRQAGKRVFCGMETDWLAASLTNTTPTLQDLAAFLPPVPVTATFTAVAGSGAASHVAIGPLLATNLTATTAAGGPGKAVATAAASWAINVGPLFAEYQACMTNTSAGNVTAVALYVLEYELP